MTTWPTDALTTIGATDEITITPTRPDGTPGPRRPIWVVTVDGNVYVRSYRGAAGGWHQYARRSRRGQITAAGTTYDVTFVEPHDPQSATIDAAYRHKYANHGRSYVDAVVTAAAGATTLRLDPATAEETPR